ncbi:nicotinate-nucleotide pyrophosphorylase (carboxylating) [Methylobacterium brachiatum]|jgi:nicotinate-nucleotide pyrophosphorylase (carboxylating)|uniref:Probable nicotinate-nucleotide pyrophosphorylase [carboxylating] n=1 Tax=Methylobacterium brachiatum TaxID=269660 RepID=A0AAJ1TNQ4_9HYPH|nr:carboxylating nicotinate-nucleotide diphosphorylase [Methylobacterium brachiatum]MCB4803682.1 carboxylating nicotinate-nucleotide diphosphorylase [Methylobacterium brachiatum]MDQ0542119.1 nicotinate-nucleotide pyrophosphorylase (carboxylating) [Methylobacterium brachiatum]
MTQSVLTQSVLTAEILPLPRLLVEPVVRAALVEDLGRAGDITTDAIVPPGERMRGVIASRQAGVISGTDAASIAFALIDPAVTVTVERSDGARVSPGDVVLRLEGPARAILTAERVALNLLCRMSGVATATNGLVEAARPHGNASIVCTRKTTPGLRALEKHAVRAGGGSNHRFGLDDAVLIKDNHVAVAGGIVPAIERARARAGHLVKIECEVDSLDQLEEALSIGVDAVLLDNMGPDLLTRAVAMIDGRALSEASGRITRETVGAVAASGVDLISCGWITHSAAIIDLGLDAA